MYVFTIRNNRMNRFLLKILQAYIAENPYIVGNSSHNLTICSRIKDIYKDLDSDSDKIQTLYIVQTSNCDLVGR